MEGVTGFVVWREGQDLWYGGSDRICGVEGVSEIMALECPCREQRKKYVKQIISGYIILHFIGIS